MSGPTDSPVVRASGTAGTSAAQRFGVHGVLRKQHPPGLTCRGDTSFRAAKGVLPGYNDCFPDDIDTHIFIFKAFVDSSCCL